VSSTTTIPATPKRGLTIREKCANRDGDGPWILRAPSEEQSLTTLLALPDTSWVKQQWLKYHEQKGQ